MNQFEHSWHSKVYPTMKGRLIMAMKSKAITTDEMADILQKEFHFKTFKDTEEVLCYDYNCGLYRYHGESVIKQLVEEKLVSSGLAEQATRHYVSEVIGHIQRRTYIDREKFNSQPNLLNLKNGILDLDTMGLKTHTKDFLSTIMIPVSYDPKADCPLIKKVFSEIIAVQFMPLLEEIIGWCLEQHSGIQRLVLFLGEGANGKSTFLELLRRFLGMGNCSSVALQAFNTQRFASALLYGKLANIYADLPMTALKETAALKVLTGGDAITAEKKFQHPFSFVNRAKLIFSANRPPLIPDNSLAVWRRWMVIKFPNKFIGDGADKNLLVKLSTERELSGLLNIALQGLNRLRKNGDFSYRMTIDQVRDRYILLSDPVITFLEEKCFFDPQSSIKKEELYQSYIEFCKKKKIAGMTKKGFGHTIKQKQLPIKERRDEWRGIGIA